MTPHAQSDLSTSYTTWRSASQRACDRSVPERDAYIAFMEAEREAMRLATVPAQSVRDLALKLRVFMEETRAGETPIGNRLLQAVVADAERLAGMGN